tara:strand:+ start:3000 stop:3461 length:462 start_codon:yes stop_codon:yes gene_type:complete
MKKLLIVVLFFIKVVASENINTLDKNVIYNQKSKSPLVAGLCALAPTMGHLYVEKWDRINPISSLIISPIISVILLHSDETLKKERTFISNMLIPPKVVWYFLQIQDAIYLANQHNAILYEEIYGIKDLNEPKISIIEKMLKRKNTKATKSLK